MVADHPGAAIDFTGTIGTSTDPLSTPSLPMYATKVADELAALQGDNLTSPRYIAGRWYALPYSGTSVADLGEGNLDVVWWDLPVETVITEIAEEVTTGGAAGAVRRIGVYAHNATTGLPSGAPLYELSTPYDATSTGLKTTGTISVTVTGSHGVWIGGVTQGAAATRPIIRQINTTTRGIHSTGAGILGSQLVGFRHAAVSGALPTFTAAPTISGGAARQAIKIG
jgi:hypothetical protein